MERRLAAILAADVVGYSRLMGEDETGTLAALKAHRAELIDPKAAQYNGRTIKLMGDGALMEFPSVVEAVTFAVEVQCAMRERNADIPGEQQFLFRIGINLGDVIVEGDDIYGDGVNLAARLEGLAEPGGICVRRAVRNQVRDRLDLDFEDRGEIEVKNIVRPVRVFAVVLNEKAKALATPIEAIPVKTERRRWSAVAAALVMSLVAVVGLLWWQPWTPKGVPAPTEQAALPLPDKPSIAVLAFDNLSGDPEQDYFADAVAESISTELSRNSGLFVISYDSALAYKGKAHTDRQIGRELGVRYVLRGSVQKGDDRLRITAKLADSFENKLVWASSYDEPLVDILVVQDKITEQIVATLGETIWQTAARSLKPKPLKDFSAYDFTLKGLDHLHRFTKEDNLKARELFIRSRAIDPDIFVTHIGLGWTWFLEWRFGWDDVPDALERAVAEARRAAEIEPMHGEVYRLLARVNLQWRNFDQVLALSERAVKLSPNNSDILASPGLNLNYLGR
ncbi:MAG: adenylate/guanylate cyclase domain-containing protein, partial [Hyphomicrobium sp.]